jgi:predicted SnoaL-like aldol condensation-catalyzing enzyme
MVGHIESCKMFAWVVFEHWDRIQPIPETSKNGDTMF